MPIPEPAGETRDEFLARCMSDRTMREEFGEVRQRAAVCFQKWQEYTENSREV